MKRSLKSSWMAVIPLLFLLMPETAAASSAGGLGTITDFLKEIVNFVFVEWGFYIACLAVAICLWAGWAGHMQWKTVGTLVLSIIIFFSVPEIIGNLRDGARGAL
jgi:type IV secretory pathway VirB2 component (pilin)